MIYFKQFCQTIMFMTKFNQHTKEKILTAAESVFHENGLKGARTTAIAERAGVSRTMLHYYFSTKEELFHEVLQNTLGFFMESAQKLFVEIKNLKTLIDELIDLLYDMTTQKPGLPSFMVNILNENPDLLTALPFIQEENIPALFDKLLEEARAKNEIQSDISGENLLLNIYGLTSMPYLAIPLIKFKESRTEEDMTFFLERRKEMIKTFVWNAIKK